MIKIEKALPGEQDGTINPEDYGFDVIKEEPLTKDQEIERIGRLYERVKELTGAVIPKLEPYLEAHGEGRATEGERDSR